MLTGMSITEVGCLGSGIILAGIEGAAGSITLQEERNTTIPNKVNCLKIEAELIHVPVTKYLDEVQNILQFNRTFSLNGTRKITRFNLSKLI
jgi:hypothetical protein